MSESNPTVAQVQPGRERHPEDFCEQCQRPNVVWFAPSPLWNKVVRERKLPEILCPVCFIQVAEDAGVRLGAWRVAPEDYADDIPSPLPVEQRCVKRAAWCDNCWHNWNPKMRIDGVCQYRETANDDICGCKCVFTPPANSEEPEMDLADMLRLRKELDPDAPDMIVVPDAAPEGEVSKPTRIEGWILGNQYQERGYYDGRQGDQGEPWYVTVDGTHWSALDVSFWPNHEFHGVPHPNNPSLLLCDFVFHHRRCDMTAATHSELFSVAGDGAEESELLTTLWAAANYITRTVSSAHNEKERRVVLKALGWQIQQASATPSPSGDAEREAREIVGTVFRNTTASPETLERVMAERIASALSSRSSQSDDVKTAYPHPDDPEPVAPWEEDSGDIA